MSIKIYLTPALERQQRGGNFFAIIREHDVFFTKNPQFCLVYFLFLVVYQKKYLFCLHVFQNMFIFAAYYLPVTYKVTGFNSNDYPPRKTS